MADMTKDPRSVEAMRRWDELKSDRTRFEQDWEDMARLIRPQRGGFTTDDHTTRTMEKPLSSAPLIAQSAFVGELFGSATNPATNWMGVTTPDQDLNNWQPMRDWLGQVSRRILASFNTSVSSFYDATIQCYADISVFGNGVQYDEVNQAERRIMDITLSLAEVVWDVDGWGRVVEVVRRFRLRPHQAMNMPFAAGLPPKVRELAEKGSTDRIVFFHHVRRNDAWRQGALGPRGKPWVSRYVCEIEATLVREAGYDEMPFYVPRWDVDSGMTIGTGPGFNALPSARVNQRMDDATIRAAQFAADPTKLAPDRETWQTSGVVRPGAMIYGGVNMRGERMIHTLDQSANIGLTMEEKRQKLEEIKDAFFWTLLSVTSRTGLNDLEILEIQAQRQRLWAPNMGRIQSELLAPKVSRRFALLWRAGQLPPPPAGAEGVALQVEYQSAASAAQQSAEAASMMRIVNDIAPLVQLKPRLADRIDEDGFIEALAAARGAPPGFLRSREAADQIGQARQQQIEAAQQVDVMERGAGMIRDVSQAERALPAQ